MPENDTVRLLTGITPPTATVIERYEIVSRYMNNQTDEEWERLRAALAETTNAEPVFPRWIVTPDSLGEDANAFGEWQCPNGHGDLRHQEFHVESWDQTGESDARTIQFSGDGECIYEANKEDCIYCPTCNLEMDFPPDVEIKFGGF